MSDNATGTPQPAGTGGNQSAQVNRLMWYMAVPVMVVYFGLEVAGVIPSGGVVGGFAVGAVVGGLGHLIAKSIVSRRRT